MTAQQTDWLLIDGYSLLYRARALSKLSGRNLAVERHLLIRKVEQGASDWADRITIVFDGRATKLGNDEIPSTVEVLYAPGHLTADSVIERLVYANPESARILVVSSDRAERETVAAAGADTLSCGEFLDRIEGRTSHHRRRPPSAEGRAARLGDFFPRTD